MSKEQKIYCKVGEIFLKTITVLALNGVFIGMFALWLLEK
jgi:hypothetical protein